jgi:hypothetical protein
MTKPAAPDAPHDFARFDAVDYEIDGAGQEEEGLDLEAYLDLEENDEIARLVDGVRAGAGAERRAAPQARGREAPEAPRPAGGGAVRHPTPGAPAKPTMDGAPAEPPAPRGVRRGVGERGRPEAPGAAPEVRSQESPAAPPALDLAAVARALGRVQVQGRQLVVGCPACDGRASIVVYANRFKCFTCEATGDEAALAAHLTGWEERRVAGWLEAARESLHDAADVRRPWRLSFFSR